MALTGPARFVPSGMREKSAWRKSGAYQSVRYKPEQIVTMLPQIEVCIANGKTTPHKPAKSADATSTPTISRILSPPLKSTGVSVWSWGSSSPITATTCGGLRLPTPSTMATLLGVDLPPLDLWHRRSERGWRIAAVPARSHNACFEDHPKTLPVGLEQVRVRKRIPIPSRTGMTPM
jgi:hypothetical protein